MAPPNDNENRERTVIITEKVDIGEKQGREEPYLIQISGRETGQTYHLQGTVIKIGRDASNTIALEDPHVSRNHAEIHINGEKQIVIKDLGSTNGIFVNGTKVNEANLNDGDKILIGTRLYFKFSYQDAVEQNYQQSIFKAANIDNLTQLYNKKYFIDALSKEFSYSKRNLQPLSLLMVDIDYFKKINDTYGHPAGDLVLKVIGAIILKNTRLENIACRFGGEEFAIILRTVKAETAFTISERLRKMIEAETINYRSQLIRCTLSIGIASMDNESYDTIEDFIRAADENLYSAKELGRNRSIQKKAA